MKILSVNAGSSSLKFQLIEMPEELQLVEGLIERIGMDKGKIKLKINGEKFEKELEIKDHKEGVKLLVEALLENNVVSKVEDIEAVGHRMVHGGEKFNQSVILTDEVLSVFESLIPLAPLHNPANLTGVEAFKEILPNALMVGVFDTAFHQTMEKEAYMYATPYDWYEKYSVRKYGFHGTSHRYVSEKCAEILENENAKIIVAHLGNGGSLCAVNAGKSIDTTMGFTPLAGIPMGTRSGDIDPAIIEFICEKENKSVKEVTNMLNKESGFKGVSGVSSDSRDIEDAIANGNERAILAQDIYTRKIASYIAIYDMLLKGSDAICFTGGIGENAADTRKEIIERLSSLGVKIDLEKNNVRGKETLISTEDSKIKVFIIPTNEELMIARDTFGFTK
jgi:acetate kinase